MASTFMYNSKADVLECMQKLYRTLQDIKLQAGVFFTDNHLIQVKSLAQQLQVLYPEFTEKIQNEIEALENEEQQNDTVSSQSIASFSELLGFMVQKVMIKHIHDMHIQELSKPQKREEFSQVEQFMLAKGKPLTRFQHGEPTSCLRIENLNKTTTRADLLSMFSEELYGTIHILVTKNKFFQTAFIRFQSKEQAKSAFDANYDFLVRECHYMVQFID